MSGLSMLQSWIRKPNTGTKLVSWGVDSDAEGAYRLSPHSEYARGLSLSRIQRGDLIGRLWVFCCVW